MPALVSNLLKIVFIILLYLFLWQVARAIAGHIGSGIRRSPRASSEALMVVRSETQAGMRIDVKDGLVMGRSPDADQLLDDPYASQFHFRVTRKDGRIVLADLGSTNGTYVNGRRITTPQELARGDAVQVGKTIMEVR